MMKLFKISLSFILFTVIFQTESRGQNNSLYLGEVKKIITDMKNTRNMAYMYSLSAEYPNGQEDRLKGEIYLGNDDKFMYNSNSAFTMIYSTDWYYNANHRDKTIALVNINKHLHKDYKDGIEKDMFENNALIVYLDSVVMKYGTIKSLRKDNDTVRMELGFPTKMPIRNIRFVYDEKNKVMVSYSTNTFQPWKNNEFGKDKGVRKTITCWNFRKTENNRKYKTEYFFAIKKNKALLKKYKKYTLTSKL